MRQKECITPRYLGNIPLMRRGPGLRSWGELQHQAVNLGQCVRTSCLIGDALHRPIKRAWRQERIIAVFLYLVGVISGQIRKGWQLILLLREGKWKEVFFCSLCVHAYTRVLTFSSSPLRDQETARSLLLFSVTYFISPWISLSSFISSH